MTRAVRNRARQLGKEYAAAQPVRSEDDLNNAAFSAMYAASGQLAGEWGLDAKTEKRSFTHAFEDGCFEVWKEQVGLTGKVWREGIWQ